MHACTVQFLDTVVKATSRLSYKFRDGEGGTQLVLVGKMPLLRETTITMSSSNNFGTKEFQESCIKNEKLLI